MRGDSLRDLYAKTLALMGLGVLAGAGALVDFWPAGFKLATVSSALRLPEVAGDALAVPPAALDVPSPRVVPVHARVTSPAAASLPASSVVVASDLNLFTTDSAVAVGAPAFAVLQVTEDMPASDTVAEVATPALVTPQVMTLASVLETGEAPTPGLESWTAAPAALDALQSADDPGFLSSALRKTQSLVRTSARTGASIVDAFRVGFGAVRRALPTSRDQSFRLGT